MTETGQDYRPLVFDALYERDMSSIGCFLTNNAADRLDKTGPAILPLLESVFRDEVMADFPFDQSAQHRTYPGAASLLVTYFQLAQLEPDRAIAFLESLQGALLAEAIRAAVIAWGHRIPERLLPTIDRAAQSDVPKVREIARWALDWHRKKELADGVHVNGVPTSSPLTEAASREA